MIRVFTIGFTKKSTEEFADEIFSLAIYIYTDTENTHLALLYNIFKAGRLLFFFTAM